MPNQPILWTDEKVELLKQYYPNSTWDQLFKILEIYNKDSIRHMASRYKINRDIYNKCHRSQEEIDFIKLHCSDMSASEIGRHFGREATFIIHVAEQEGIELDFNRGLHEEDVELFKKIYPKYTNKYLSEKYFTYLTPQQIRCQARKFGLVKNEEKSVKWYDKEDLLEKLEISIRKLGRVPMLTELQGLGLPSETTFRRYFGGLTKACELIGVERPCYQKVFKTQNLATYDKMGNPCLSQTEQIIGNFLTSKGFSYEKEVEYSSVIPSDIAGARRFDWKIGEYYIEYFGLVGYDFYDTKVAKKKQIIQDYNIPCLFLYPSDMSKEEKWQNKILNFLNDNEQITY